MTERRFAIVSICAGLAVLVLAYAGCACWQAAHAQEPKCVVLHQTVDCTEGAIGALLPGLVPILGDLITGNSADIDWNAVQQRLEAMGFKDGGCLLAALEADFLAHPRTGPRMKDHMVQIHSRLTDWKMRVGGDKAIKFKVRVGDRLVLQ